MIGMLCWILNLVFPSQTDIHKIAPKQADREAYLDIYRSTNWPIVKEYDLSNEKGNLLLTTIIQLNIFLFEMLKLNKTTQKSMKKKYLIYQLLESVSSNNSNNQEYLTKYFKIIVSHIGYGDFVCTSIQNMFCKNSQILESIAKTTIEDNQQNANQGGYYGKYNQKPDYMIERDRLYNQNRINNSQSDYDNSENGQSYYKGQKTFLQEIVDKFSSFELYSLPELVKLLANFCVVNNSALYIIQESIFQQICGDPSFTRQCFIPIEVNPRESEELEHLKITVQQIFVEQINGEEIKQIEKPLISFIAEKKDAFLDKQMTYVQQQLILMANMCKDRNYNSYNEFQQNLPLQILVQFITQQIKKDRNTQLMAGFLKMIMNMYIDKYPNQKQTRPNLIVNLDLFKTLNQNLNNSGIEGGLDQSIDLKRGNSVAAANNGFSLKGHLPSGLNGITRKQSNIGTRNRQKSLKQFDDQRFNLNQQHLLHNGQANIQDQQELTNLKDQLLKDLENQMRQLQQTSVKSEVKQNVYNTFTLELIHTLTIMLQFGLFNESTGLTIKKQKDKSSIFAYFINLTQKQEQQEVSELERIIKALSVILEFDERYYSEIETLSIKRKYTQHQYDKSNMYSKVLKQTKTITKILTKNDEKNRIKQQKIFSNNFDIQSDIIKDPIFKKVQGLKKILFKYTNKTFSVREKNENMEIEEAIKIQICKFFCYLLDMRQDFFLENIIQYFQQVIYLFSTYLIQIIQSQLNCMIIMEFLVLLMHKNNQKYRKLIRFVELQKKQKNF